MKSAWKAPGFQPLAVVFESTSRHTVGARKLTISPVQAKGLHEMSARPNESDVRKLFGKSMNRCAFEKCPNNIIELSSGVIVGQICHINAKSPKGPRYLSSQTDKERHGYDNLVLLCRPHHAIIDHKQSELEYSAEFLRALKARHEAAGEAAPAGPQISDDQVETLIQASVVYEAFATRQSARVC